MEVKQIAQALVDSLSIRENSFDHNAARQAEKDWDKKYGDLSIIDYKKFYTKTIEESIHEACVKNDLPEEMERLIDFALYWSNDIVSWCEEQGVKYLD